MQCPKEEIKPHASLDPSLHPSLHPSLQKIALFWLLVLMGLAASAAPVLAGPTLSPWYGGEAFSKVIRRINGSFLGNREIKVAKTGLREIVLDPVITPDLKKSYEARVRQYELLRFHDLHGGAMGQRTYLQEMQEFSYGVLEQLRGYHQNLYLTRVRSALVRDPLIQKIRRPVEIVALAVMIYQGQRFEFPVGDTRIAARADFKSDELELAVDSPAIRGAFTMYGRAPGYRNPFAAPPSDQGSEGNDPVVMKERYRFSLSGGVPLLNVSAGVDYAATTRKLSATMSKTLTRDLTCEVGMSRHLVAEAAPVRNGDESVRLVYARSF